MPNMEEFFTLDQATALQDAFRGVYSRIAKVEEADKSAQQIMLTLPAGATDLDSAIEIAIQDYLEPLLSDRKFQVVPSGALIAFSGTLAQARALQGYQVCDGTDGTPDLRNLFLRGAGGNENAGGSGGADTQTSDVAVADHADHDHTIAASGSSCPLCVDGAGTAFSLATHVHTMGGVSDDGARTHALTIQPLVTVPSYYSVIWIRKR